MRDTILRFINSNVGITNQKLRLDLMAEYGATKFDSDEFNKIIDELVDKTFIVRVQFVIPSINAALGGMRNGALYLPERTIVTVNQAEYHPFKSRR